MINYKLETTSTSHFTSAIAANGTTPEIETFPGLRGDGLGEITSICIESMENLDWQVELMNQSYAVKEKVLFEASHATEYTISGVKKYYYSATDLNIPVPFEGGYDTVLVGLRNMSTTAKTAGTAGALTVTLVVQK